MRPELITDPTEVSGTNGGQLPPDHLDGQNAGDEFAARPKNDTAATVATPINVAGTDPSPHWMNITLHTEKERTMLVLSRKKNESIIIGDDITIVVAEIRKGRVRLGIEAPSAVKVHRQEVYEAIRRAAQQATQEQAIAG